MMAATMSVLETILIFAGIFMILRAIIRYGKRTNDWKGTLTMFFKRVPMKVDEFRWYKLGVSFVLFGIVIRVVNMTFWPIA